MAEDRRPRGYRGELGLLVLFLAAGCGDASQKVGLPPVGGDGDTGGTTGGGGPGGGPVIAAHCRIDGDAEGDEGGDTEDPDDSDDAGGASGFKFDTAPPPSGNDLPPSCDEAAATRSNLGCLFWAVDLPNDPQGTPMSPPAASQQFAVVVANSSSIVPATVEVFVGDAEVPVATAEVPPDETRTLRLDPLDIDPLAPSTDGLAYRVESDLPVTAYQFNPLDNTVPVYSNDASLLLPEHALALDYTAVTAHAILLAQSSNDPNPILAPAFVSVVGTEADTTVLVQPTGELQVGPTEQVIGRGQVFTVLSTLGGASAENLSGTRIVADRPVAVFSGNVATSLPEDAQACCADHLEQQMPPGSSWGTRYAAVPPAAPDNRDELAEYRIMAAFDDTELLYCPRRPPGAPSQLAAGEGVSFVSNAPFTVVSADPERPILVTQFLLSLAALERTNDGSGDPAMIVLTPRAQHQLKTVFAVPEGYARNYVAIHGPPGEVRLDGVRIDESRFVRTGTIDGEAVVHARIELDAGNHVIESSRPVGVTVFGFDNAVSYGFPGGTGLRVVAPVPPVG